MTSSPQLPSTSAIALDSELKATSEKWFEYMVRVQPHHTDYGGVVWHGTYLTWMETARVECLRSIGINFEELVSLGCDLPVVDLSIRYRRSLRLGQTAVVKTRMNEVTGVRIDWDYAIECLETKELCITGKVTLVAIDREKGKIMRQLPANVKNSLIKLHSNLEL